MSGRDRTEERAFRELEAVVRTLGDELATFRRRALDAETHLKELGHTKAKSGSSRTATVDHGSDLESENHALRTRLERAEDRVRQMMDRVRFLRQQLQSQTPAIGASR